MQGLQRECGRDGQHQLDSFADPAQNGFAILMNLRSGKRVIYQFPFPDVAGDGVCLHLRK